MTPRVPPITTSAPPAAPPVIPREDYCPRCGGRGHVSTAEVCRVCNRTGLAPFAPFVAQLAA